MFGPFQSEKRYQFVKFNVSYGGLQIDIFHNLDPRYEKEVEFKQTIETFDIHIMKRFVSIMNNLSLYKSNEEDPFNAVVIRTLIHVS